MLTQRRPNRLSLLSASLVAGLVALPLAVAFAVDPQPASQPAPKGQPSVGAHTAVLRGRVTNEAGAPLAGVRVRVAIPAADMRFVGAGAERGFVKSPRITSCTSCWKPGPTPEATTAWRSPGLRRARWSRSTRSSPAIAG